MGIAGLKRIVICLRPRLLQLVMKKMKSIANVAIGVRKVAKTWVNVRKVVKLAAFAQKII
jgi:hypothetical protein